MNHKIYYIDFGYVTDTIVYELVPKEVARFELKTLDEIKLQLHAMSVHHAIADSAYPKEINYFKKAGFHILTI